MSTPSIATPAVERRRRWTGARVTALVIGTLFVLLSLALLAAGGTGLWAEWTQRDAGYVTTSGHSFSTPRSALATEHTQLGSAGVGWLYSPGLLGKVRIRVTPVGAGEPLFVGIGRSSDVDRYLAGVNHTVISNFFENEVEAVAGGTAQSPPETQQFWVATATGRGARTLLWNPKKGSWTVVVMNATREPGSPCGRTWELACRRCCGSPSAHWAQGRPFSWAVGS